MPSALRISTLICLSLVLGCSRHERPEHVKTATVTGIATFQDKPLDSFQVVFTPADGKRPATGNTGPDGKFELGTNKPGDGAAIGLHKVSVVYAPPATEDSAVANPIDDPRKMPKPPVQLPAKYGNPETSELTVDVPAGGLKDYKLELK